MIYSKEDKGPHLRLSTLECHWPSVATETTSLVNVAHIDREHLETYENVF